MQSINSLAFIWFSRLLRFRWATIIVCIILIGSTGQFLSILKKDTTPGAFVPADSPVLVFRDQVEEIFGLKDPMVIAVVSTNKKGIYQASALQLVDWLTEQVSTVEGIDPSGVTSLATEKDIRGTADGMLVESFWDQVPQTQADADQVRQRVDNFSLMLGTLAARDGSGTLIILELLPNANQEQIYFDLLALTELAKTQGLVGSDVELHVAGQGAVSGYLSAYIAADANRLNPIAGVIITIILLLAFRSLAGTLLPNFVVLGTVAVGLGSMAAAGVPMYVITTSLPVILIGIAVCDSIHIFSQYYEELEANPDISGKEAIARAMSVMWRPVTLTTVTTIAGFLGLAIASSMPPMQAYGLFAAIGIFAAWLWTLTLLPALLSFFRPRARKTKKREQGHRANAISRIMTATGRVVANYPREILIVAAVCLVVAAVGASRIQFNDQRIFGFQESEPLRIADGVINSKFDGTYYLDVAITTPDTEDLFMPKNLRQIEKLQVWMESEGGLYNTTSIVDYIKQMHQSLNEGNPDYYAIPDDPALIAQYFLLYSVSGEPNDFEEEIDYDYRLAHVRGQLKGDNFQKIEPVVLGLKQYLVEKFNSDSIRGNTTGAIDLSYSWLEPLGRNTASGMALALVLVLVASVVFFRSFMVGFIATLPVAFAVLVVFAIMGYANIWVGVGTSMFAAIAIGLGVDFAIHTIDRLRKLIRGEGASYEEAVTLMFPTTGRALLFNVLALALGFGILMTSKVPPLQDFGLLVAVAVVTSFVTSLTIMPALIAVIRPKAMFLDQPRKAGGREDKGKVTSAAAFLFGTVAISGLISISAPASATESLNGTSVMAAVFARPEGLTQRSNLKLDLIDSRGKSRSQETIALRKYYGDDKRQAMFYLEPSNVRDTAFLTYDYADPARDDDQWLYLPALRKTRRISASDRGDYFLGTDLTYEDLKRQNKVSISDWIFTLTGKSEIDGTEVLIIEGLPASELIAQELGYGRGRWYVDPVNHTILKADNWDAQDNQLKSAVFSDIRQVDGIWTVHKITVVNHKTGHQTKMLISDVSYNLDIEDSVFEERALRRGYRQ